MLRAAKVAEKKPPLTQEGAAKLNALTSRCFSRATALQEMEEARAALAAALEPSRSAGVASLFVQEGTKKSRSADDRSVNVNAFDHLIAVPALERAVARARVGLALAARGRRRGRRGDAGAMARHRARARRHRLARRRQDPPRDCVREKGAPRGGDARRGAGARRDGGGGRAGRGRPPAESLLRREQDGVVLRRALRGERGDAAHDSRLARRHRRRARAGHQGCERGQPHRRRGDARARAEGNANVASSFEYERSRVSFAASGAGTRGPIFQGSDELGTDVTSDATELYVLNWDDEAIELYVGGAGPKTNHDLRFEKLLKTKTPPTPTKRRARGRARRFLKTSARPTRATVRMREASMAAMTADPAGGAASAPTSSITRRRSSASARAARTCSADTCSTPRGRGTRWR